MDARKPYLGPTPGPVDAGYSPAPTNLPVGLHLSTPQVMVDDTGGAPTPATLAFPTEWVGGQARQFRFAARLATTGTVTWSSGGTAYSTSTDPDFIGSIVDLNGDEHTHGPIAGSGFTATGSPTASAQLVVLAGISDGTYLTPAVYAILAYAELVTGHAYFPTANAPAGSSWLHVAVTLGATPPTITDGNGFTWTTLAQEQFGGGYITCWAAPIARNCGSTGEHVTVSETLDSSIGLCIAGTVI